MKIKNITNNYNLIIRNDIPLIVDDNTSEEGREITMEPFQSINTLNKNNSIQLEHKGKILFKGKCERTEQNYKITNITPYRTQSITITEPRIISQSYDYDGETQTADLPVPDFEGTDRSIPIATDNIIIAGKSSIKNKLTYDFNSGIIRITRKV